MILFNLPFYYRESNKQIGGGGRTPKRQRPVDQSDPEPQAVCPLVSDELEAEVPHASDASTTNADNNRLEHNIENELSKELDHIDECQPSMDRNPGGKESNDAGKEDTVRLEGKGGEKRKKKSRLARSLEIDMVADTFNPSSRRRGRVKPQVRLLLCIFRSLHLSFSTFRYLD